MATGPPPRPMRADARRNYARLVAAATECIAEHGADAPLDEIARRAGVGAGTLYRHFPNRLALLAAVHRDAVEEVCAHAHRLLDSEPPMAALDEWVRLLVAYVGTKHGLSSALLESFGRGSQYVTWCKQVIEEAAGALLAAAAQSGQLRPEIGPRELLHLAHGVAVATENLPDAVDLMTSVLLDGLRARPPEGHGAGGAPGR